MKKLLIIAALLMSGVAANANNLPCANGTKISLSDRATTVIRTTTPGSGADQQPGG